MVRVLTVVGCLLVAGLVVLGYHYFIAPPALNVRTGDPLPDLELWDVPGNSRMRLSAMRGKPAVVVVFDTSWPETIPYLKQMEKLRALYHDRGLVLVGIAVDAEPGPAENLLRTEQINFYVLRDPGATYVRPAFGSPTPPTPDTFVVTPGLTIADAHAEPVDWRDAFARKRIEAILPPVATSPFFPPARPSP
jgi:peroxiredoxin